MPLVTSETRTEQELAQYEKDLSWVLENYDSLADKYGDEFVAVLNQKVIGHATQIEELTDELRSEHGKDLNRILIEFIYKEHPNFVLRA